MSAAEIDILGQRRGAGGLGRALLWLGAAAAALAAHGVVAVLALRSAPLELREAGPPPAVMVELAPEPAAPEAEMDRIAPDVVETPEVPPPEDMPDLPDVSEAVPDLTAPALPQPEAVELPLPPELPAVVPPEVAAVRPMARPKNLSRPAPPPEPEPETARREPEPPSEQRMRAQAQQFRPAEVPAAPRSARGAGSQMSPAQWQARLMAHLERRKRYPASARARREQGVAQVRFTTDVAGNVLSAQLVRSSGVAALDEAAVAMVRRASPVPAPPPGVPRDLTVPVQFALR